MCKYTKYVNRRFRMTNPVESGKICLEYNCSLCCHETKMLLTNIDVNRISKLGYKVKSFAKKVSYGWQLKNIDGKCFFLEGNRCKIYEYRPYGCRLYPLIYDWNKHKVTLDDLCPHKEKFNFQMKDVRKIFFIINLLKKNVERSYSSAKTSCKRRNRFLRHAGQ